MVKPHRLPGGSITYATDLRWFLATGELPDYVRGKSVLKMLNEQGEEILDVFSKRRMV